MNASTETVGGAPYALCGTMKNEPNPAGAHMRKRRLRGESARMGGGPHANAPSGDASATRELGARPVRMACRSGLGISRERPPARPKDGTLCRRCNSLPGHGPRGGAPKWARNGTWAPPHDLGEGCAKFAAVSGSSCRAPQRHALREMRAEKNVDMDADDPRDGRAEVGTGPRADVNPGARGETPHRGTNRAKGQAN